MIDYEWRLRYRNLIRIRVVKKSEKYESQDRIVVSTNVVIVVYLLNVNNK